MKNTVLILAAALIAGLGACCHADGFSCQNSDGSMAIKVYDKTSTSGGTRNVSVMVVSNPSLPNGQKTVARFTSSDALINLGAKYTAQVQQGQFSPAVLARPVAGTTLGDIETIELDVDFSYSNPVPNGTILAGQAALKMINGPSIPVNMTCIRYVKDQG